MVSVGRIGFMPASLAGPVVPGRGAPSTARRIRFRYNIDLTAADYVKRRTWWDASAPACPSHPQRGCELVPHGTYARKFPRSARAALSLPASAPHPELSTKRSSDEGQYFPKAQSEHGCSGADLPWVNASGVNLVLKVRGLNVVIGGSIIAWQRDRTTQSLWASVDVSANCGRQKGSRRKPWR